MKSCRSLLLLAVAACLSWSPTPLARSVTGLLDNPHEGLLPRIAALHDDSYAATDLAAVDGLDRSGRQLNLFTAVAALTSLSASILDGFIGVAAGAATDAIFGTQVVPVDLAQLINDALEEIDRIVADNIAEAFNTFQQTQLNSLARQVREYVRRSELRDSRNQISAMLTDASNLLSFFKENGVVTNNAFQTTLGLRLNLLLELLQLDELIGESEEVLEAVQASIHAQANSGRLALEDWAASFKPVTNTITVTKTRPCSSRRTSGFCSRRSSRQTDIKVCMDIRSPGLKKPEAFCKSKKCKSKHTFGHIRKRRIKRCLDSAETKFRSEVRKHAIDTGIHEFRELNEATVFGEDFRSFVEKLQAVEETSLLGLKTSLLGPRAPSSAPELPVD